MVQWVSNVLDSERNGKESCRQDKQKLWYTSAPQTLFSDLNTGLKGMVDSHGIEGKALVRVGAAFAHLLSYYVDTLHRYYASARYEYRPAAAAAAGAAGAAKQQPQAKAGAPTYDFNVVLGNSGDSKPHVFFLAQVGLCAVCYCLFVC
jgi:hypothetical protein